jgi:hypothetical protein
MIFDHPPACFSWTIRNANLLASGSKPVLFFKIGDFRETRRTKYPTPPRVERHPTHFIRRYVRMVDRVPVDRQYGGGPGETEGSDASSNSTGFFGALRYHTESLLEARRDFRHPACD